MQELINATKAELRERLETQLGPMTELALIDRENAFLLYATFCGDVERTAHALNVSPAAVLHIVEEDKWNEKLRSIIELKKSGRPGDIERAINRALNFVLAHRFRLFLERIVKRLTGMGEKDIEDEFFPLVEKSKKGEASVQLYERKVNTRCLADLASALEKCQAMSYAALNDTTGERVKRDETASSDSASDMHAKIAAAMSKVAASGSVPARLFEAQVAAGCLPDGGVKRLQRKAAADTLAKDTQQVACQPPEDPNE